SSPTPATPAGRSDATFTSRCTSTAATPTPSTSWQRAASPSDALSRRSPRPRFAVPRASCCGAGSVVGAEPCDRLVEDALRLRCVPPLVDLDPLVGLEVLVVLEEVLDLFLRVFGDVTDVLNVRPARVFR